MTPFRSLSLLLLALVSVSSVDRSKFKTCSQSGFCSRARRQNPDTPSTFKLEMETVTASPTRVESVLVNTDTDVRFRMELVGLKDNTFRVRVREAFPLVPRFEVPHVLDGEPEQATVEVKDRTDTGLTLHNGPNKVVVTASPLRLDFYSNGALTLTANARNLMRFEHTRAKAQDGGAGEAEQAENAADDDPNMWEESFSGNTDSKPHGPQAIAMDFTFHDTDHVYGIPEHADKFSLQDTMSGDPYRLYNLDVFEYELWNQMALYAAIPFMIGHNAKRTTGLFWMNAAETWIDVKKSSSGVLGSLTNLVSSSQPRVDTHWMSETGIIDMFVLLGPKPKDVSRQYAALTGTTELPPEFSVAYHQCRWNYNDQADVQMVSDKFDEHDIPMDIMWLDIEHTDGKKYFTWDSRKFPDSIGMINNLTAVGRKLVTIVDPHIKKDQSYWVHKDCTDLSLYVKDKDGKDYEGWCWPGASYYPDFLNPEVRDYFAKQYKFENYVGTNLNVFTWNDMNEPSVFNGPEVTMPKDKLHMGNVEHREMHNMYGHLYVMGTHAGHLLRSDNQQRPFILTRSAFAGSQRISAIWTGDNMAEWGHLEASVPMCLSLSIAGMSFCGADVGGFFKNPDGELFVRWYQAAAFQPFFRSHAHIDTKRREPWLYNESEMKLIRAAIRTRYSFLPFWYTLFYEGTQTGLPPMRPSWYEFPSDVDTFALEGQHMVGDALLVHPVSKSGSAHELVYFPGENQRWFDIYTHEEISHHGGINMPIVYEHIPVYQRGGTIIPKKERIRRSSALMRHDPYTLLVALDKSGKAKGTLYIDDGISYDYKTSKKMLYIQFSYDNGKLTGHQLVSPTYETRSWLEKVVIVGLDKAPASAHASLNTPTAEEQDLATQYDAKKKTLVIRKPGVNMADEWQIDLS